MVIRHLCTNINGLLNNYTTKKLGDMFEMSGSEVRKELEKLKAKGDRVIGSEGCKHFNPQTGCECHLHLETQKTLKKNI